MGAVSLCAFGVLRYHALLLLLATVLASYNIIAAQTVGLMAAAEAVAGTPSVKAIILVLSIFSLWMSYMLYELRQSAWYILIAVFSLALLSLVPSVFALNLSAVAITDFDKIGLIILGVMDLAWLVYVLSIKAYFVH